MKPVKIFLSYAREDEAYKEALSKHLQGMVRAGYIDAWNNREILPGQEWGQEIKSELENADIILFLVSSDFIASDFIHDNEIATAIKKQQAGKTIIIPIIIRPCDFQSLPLKNYQALPKDVKAISIWENQDSAWLDVVTELKRVIASVYQKDSSPNPAAKLPQYQRVKKGKVLYQIPTVMQKDKESKCRVRIAFTEELVKSMLKNMEDITIRGIRISDSMEVELLDPNEQPAFAIRTLSRKRQFIDEDDFTEWLFYVKPLFEGTFSLYLKIAIIELVEGEKEIREYVLEEEVEIITAEAPKQDEDYAFKSSGYDYNITPTGLRSATGERVVQTKGSGSTPTPDSVQPVPKAPSRSFGGSSGKGLGMLMILLVAFGGAYALSPALRGEIAWAITSSKDTRQAYVDYTLKYPNRNERVNQALTQIEDIDWQVVKKDSTSRPVIAAYLNEYPKGRHHEKATQLLENVDWKEVTRDSSVQKINEFIKSYPTSSRIDKAKELKEVKLTKNIKKGRIIGEEVNVRDRPYTDNSSIVGRLDLNDKVTILESRIVSHRSSARILTKRTTFYYGRNKEKKLNEGKVVWFIKNSPNRGRAIVKAEINDSLTVQGEINISDIIELGEQKWFRIFTPDIEGWVIQEYIKEL